MAKQKNNINLTYIIVAVIIGVAIVSFGALSFISGEKNRQIEQDKLKQTQQEESIKNSTRTNLLYSCLQKAEENFNEDFFLNSEPKPQPNYPNARLWNSDTVRDNNTKELNDDKALCAKLYGE